MRNLKKFLALVLAMMMVMSLMVTASAVTTVASDWETAYKTAYSKLSDYGVLIGVDDDGTPDYTGEFSRAQMATVIYRVATGDTTDLQKGLYATVASETFDDVKETDWFAPYVGWCYDRQLIIGYNDHQWGPTDQVTGMQVATMMLRLLGWGKMVDQNWPSNVDSQAKRVGITAGLPGSIDLNDGADRALAAFLVYNGATIPVQVTYAFGDVYLPGEPLITVDDTTTYTYDVWKAPLTKTTGVTFNWLYYTAEKTPKTVPVNPIYKEYVADTECEVYDNSNKLASGDYTVYTNGVEADDLDNDDISSTNTVDEIGAQGRWTRIYNDAGTDPLRRIVYVDTFLGVVTGTADKVTDYPAEHQIRPATANLTIYWGAYTANVIVENNINLVPGELVSLNAVTGTALSTINGKGSDTPIDTTKADAVVQNVTKLSPTPVTISSIGVKDSTDGMSVNGTYLYNCTFGYNAVDNSTDPLGTNAIGKTVNLWLDGTPEKNILAVTPGATNVGVITKRGTLQSGIDGYYNSYEITLPDGNSTTINQVKDNGEFFNTIEDAQGTSNYKGLFQLVEFVPNVNAPSYSKITVHSYVNYNGDNKVFNAGVPDALDDANGTTYDDVIVNNNTVFFVAQYEYGENEDIDKFVFSEYKVVMGFTIIDDLSVAEANTKFTKVTDGTSGTRSNLAVGAIYHVGSDGNKYADYVVVNYATKQSTPESSDPARYAYLLVNNYIADATNKYWTYNAIMDGSANKLNVTRGGNAGQVLASSGLYIYKEYTNNVYQLEPTGSAPEIVNYIKYSDNAWTYNAGVLTLTSAINTGDGHDEAASTDTTRTVTKDAKVFLINPTKGTSNPVSLSLLNTSPYSGYDLYYQYNKFGWVDLIYLIDESKTTPPIPTPPAPDPMEIINNNVGYDGNLTKLSDTSYSFKVTVPGTYSVYTEDYGCTSTVKLTTDNNEGRTYTITVTDVTDGAYVIVNRYASTEPEPTDATEADIEEGLVGGGGGGKLGGTHGGSGNVSDRQPMKDLYDSKLGIEVDPSEAASPDHIIKIIIDESVFDGTDAGATNKDRSRLVPGKGENTSSYEAQENDTGVVGINFDDGSGGDITNFTVNGVSKAVTKDDPWMYFAVAEYFLNDSEEGDLQLIRPAPTYLVKYKQGSTKYEFTVVVEYT